MTSQLTIGRAAPVVAFIAVVVASNALTNTLGLVTLLGLTATAGTWFAGLGFVLRDVIHEQHGRLMVLFVIVAGAALSALLSPQLALASGVAFLVSELADWAVYSPLRKRRPLLAAISSNTVGALVDTVLFLWLAGFPLDGTGTQIIIKVGVTTLAVLGVRLAVGHNKRGAK